MKIVQLYFKLLTQTLQNFWFSIFLSFLSDLWEMFYWCILWFTLPVFLHMPYFLNVRRNNFSKIISILIASLSLTNVYFHWYSLQCDWYHMKHDDCELQDYWQSRSLLTVCFLVCLTRIFEFLTSSLWTQRMKEKHIF